MSGGEFDHQQYKISQIADDIEGYILKNDDKTLNDWGDTNGRGYTEETIQEFKLAVWYLRQAFVYTQRVDWLISGDDGEETFHSRLASDLKNLK